MHHHRYFDCSREVPKWNTISVSGYHIMKQEVLLCRNWHLLYQMAKAYLKAAIEAGLDINILRNEFLSSSMHTIISLKR